MFSTYLTKTALFVYCVFTCALDFLQNADICCILCLDEAGCTIRCCQLTQKRRTDVRWTFGATRGVSLTAIYSPARPPSTPPSSGADLQRDLHSIIPDVFLERHALLRLAPASVLRWKDPTLPIFMNRVFKVWTLWSAAALCIIIITLMSKTIAASIETFDIYMKVVSKQVMTTRRLMTVCNVKESFALFQTGMLSHYRRSQLEGCSKR